MNRSLIVFSIIISTSFYGFSQSIEDFLEEEKIIKNLAWMAHPSNTFRYGYSNKISNNKTLITINYYDGYQTTLKVSRYGNYITNIEVAQNKDWAPAFLFVTLIKNFLIGILESDREKEDVSFFEKYFKKKLKDMNGINMACIYLTVSWVNYQQDYKQLVLERERENAIKREQAKKEREFQEIKIKADREFQNRRYYAAKNLYKKALEVLPNDSRATNKISEIEAIQEFLQVRKWKYFEYTDLKERHYNNLKNTIENRVESIIKNNHLTGYTSGKIIYKIDTVGDTTYHYEIYHTSNPEISKLIESIGLEYKLEQPYKYGYTVLAEAEMQITVDVSEKIVKVKKRYGRNDIPAYVSIADRSAIKSLIGNGPIGNYKIYLKRGSVNSSNFLNKRIENYRGIGGPQNAFLSIVVPGWGVNKVTGGEKNGVSITVWSYLLVGSAIGLKIASDNNYQKYHQARDQENIDKYYKRANDLNKTAYWVGGLGAGLWVGNFIWVTGKGFKNLNEQRKFKHSISMGTLPSQPGPVYTLSYKFNF